MPASSQSSARPQAHTGKYSRPSELSDDDIYYITHNLMSLQATEHDVGEPVFECVMAGRPLPPRRPPPLTLLSSGAGSRTGHRQTQAPYRCSAPHSTSRSPWATRTPKTR